MKYKKQIELRQDTIKRLKQLRTETRQLVQTRQMIEKLRAEQLKQTQAKLKEQIKNRDFKGVANSAKSIAKIERESKSFKALTVTSHKINSLAKANKTVTNKINAKMEAMALREARATNIVTRKIAQMRNKVNGVKLKGLKVKSNYQQYKLKKATNKYNTLVSKDKNYQAVKNDKDMSKQLSDMNKDGFKSYELNKKEVVNKEPLKDYTSKKDGNTTIYTHKKNQTQVKDTGSSLVASGGKNNQEKVASLVAVAKAKGWDLNKVQVNGSKEFKAEANKQIKAELEKQKQAEQKKQNPMDKVNQMQKQGNDNIKQLQKEKYKNNQISQAR